MSVAQDIRARLAALQPQEESPKLPMGYPGMVPLALVPPLWFAVMNPRARLAGAAA